MEKVPWDVGRGMRLFLGFGWGSKWGFGGGRVPEQVVLVHNNDNNNDKFNVP